ncbi:hypothetical protein DL95DRAFT_453323 [Leptodontidium sp. 2 PMI_412]|nr:hypothetical protein DL95DRAFT_453323 [Leptodontidium sp. 2 PMI_412]
MAQHKVFLVFVRKHHPHSLGRDCEPTITVHATLRGANNAQKTFLEADRKTKLFNKEAIFMDRTRIRVFVKDKKVDFNEYNEEDAASQNSDPFDRDSTVEPDAEDYEEIDPNLDFPLASWNPEDPMFRTRSTSLSGMNFAWLIFAVTDCPSTKEIIALIDEHEGTQIPLQDMSNIAYVVGDGND